MESSENYGLRSWKVLQFTCGANWKTTELYPSLPCIYTVLKKTSRLWLAIILTYTIRLR